jgi:demethylmenaquinone methyltransferase/2-methoxy-6-polyprenyl-1,4-benzoquinol methylase
MLSIWTTLSNMGNEYYSPGEQRAAQVNRLFAAIAPRYDLINDIQSLGAHRRWKRRVASLAAVKPGDRALDLCCGTGDISFALATSGATVTGLDFSDAMLAVAESRNSKSKNENVKFFQGDAQKTSFANESFDAVTVGFGLRNLASWEAGLDEMARVAKPGARVIVLDFGKPHNGLWRWIYFTYLKLLVPLLGLLVCGKPSAYAYIIASLHDYPAQRGVEARMRTLGLVNVRTDNFIGGAMSINYGEKPSLGGK